MGLDTPSSAGFIEKKFNNKKNANKSSNLILNKQLKVNLNKDFSFSPNYMKFVLF